MKKRMWMLMLSLMVCGLAACPGEGEPDPVPECGASGQDCCETSPACDSPLVCNTGGKCGQPQTSCGANGQACCADHVCNTGLFCGSDNMCSLG